MTNINFFVYCTVCTTVQYVLLIHTFQHSQQTVDLLMQISPETPVLLPWLWQSRWHHFYSPLLPFTEISSQKAQPRHQQIPGLRPHRRTATSCFPWASGAATGAHAYCVSAVIPETFFTGVYVCVVNTTHTHTHTHTWTSSSFMIYGLLSSCNCLRLLHPPVYLWLIERHLSKMSSPLPPPIISCGRNADIWHGAQMQRWLKALSSSSVCWQWNRDEVINLSHPSRRKGFDVVMGGALHSVTSFNPPSPLPTFAHAFIYMDYMLKNRTIPQYTQGESAAGHSWGQWIFFLIPVELKL